MKTLSKIALGLMLAAVVACGGSTDTPDPLQSLKVKVSPKGSIVNGGDQVTFSATVTSANPTGLDTSVTWSVQGTGSGSITSAGVYTAPAAAGTYTVVATAKADGKTFDTAKVTVRSEAIAVTPNSATVVAGGSQQFQAALSGLSSTNVTWSVQEGAAGGSIDANGIYTAPGKAGTYHVVVTSVADPSLSATAVVTVPQVTVAVSPTSATVSTASTQTFTATVGNSAVSTVSWSVVEQGGGSITAAGVYTAPTSPGVFHVKATSNEDPTASATAAVTVQAVSVAISPNGAVLDQGQTQAFTATVANSSNQAVTWSLAEQIGGSIDGSGNYTAPNTAGSFHVVATSVADPSKQASVTVVVRNVGIAITTVPSGAVDQGASFTFAATVTGTSNHGVTWSATGGSIDAATGAWVAPTAAGPVTITAISQADGSKTDSVVVAVAPVTVTVSPNTQTLDEGALQTFSATVTGATNQGVTWSVLEGASGGTVDSSGHYTAPNAAGTFHVVATSASDGTTGSATVTVNPIVVTVSPNAKTLDQGAQQTFSATVTGAASTAVTWSVQEGAAGGTVDGSGNYTAPNTAGTYHVVATSAQDGSTTGSATITVNPIVVTVTPNPQTLDQGAQQLFSASVTGAANSAVTWSVQEGAAGGTVDAAGNYTAPNTAGTYHVVATSAQDGTTTGSATVTVNAVSVSINPTSVTIGANATQTFTATVTGTTNTAVTWSVQEGAAGGTVDAAGLYTAPGSVGTYHVVVTSVADNTKSATATVNVQAASGLAYVDPTSSGWKLVKDAASTSTHLVLDLVGPAGGTGRGISLKLGGDPANAPFAKVQPGDSELAENVAYALGSAPQLFKTATPAPDTLLVGVFQKGTTQPAVSYTGAMVKVAVDFAAAGGAASGQALTLAALHAQELGPTGAPVDVTVAVGTLTAQ